jgi:integrase
MDHTYCLKHCIYRHYTPEHIGAWTRLMNALSASRPHNRLGRNTPGLEPSRRAVRQNEEHFGIEHFTPHDLRRTAASFMTKLKIPRLHVEKVLNHSTGDIAEAYDRHDYLAEKRTALVRWAEELKALTKTRDERLQATAA